MGHTGKPGFSSNWGFVVKTVAEHEGHVDYYKASFFVDYILVDHWCGSKWCQFQVPMSGWDRSQFILTNWGLLLIHTVSLSVFSSFLCSLYCDMFLNQDSLLWKCGLWEIAEFANTVLLFTWLHGLFRLSAFDSEPVDRFLSVSLFACPVANCLVSNQTKSQLENILALCFEHFLNLHLYSL